MRPARIRAADVEVAHGTAVSGVASRRSAETVDHFLVAGEPARRLLREREPTVNLDFEDAAAGAAKTDVSRGSPFEQQIPRRTGARLVASLSAVFDLDFHDIFHDTGLTISTTSASRFDRCKSS
jgi:hypothetical protein